MPSPEPLVEISPPAYDVDLFIAYATAQNFTGKPVYARPGCYLHPDAAACLEPPDRLSHRGLAFGIEICVRLVQNDDLVSFGWQIHLSLHEAHDRISENF